MKVMIVTGSMRRGGAERVISIVSNYYASLGWDICLVRCLFPEIEYDIDAKIRTIDLSKAGSNQILDTPRLILKLRSIIKQEEPDALLSFMMTINFVTALACKGLNVNFYPSERNDPATERSKFWKNAGEWAYSQSTKAIMQTNYAKKCFNQKVQSKSIIIPNPVTVNEYADSEKEKVIVTVGRLEKQKNQKMLIHAFSIIHKSHPDYKLRIYGKGSLEGELRELTYSLNIDEYVEFMGNVNDVHHQIRKASLFVLCSDYEGLSNALIEAMMMGLTCISTDCAGSEEIVDNGESGIIIKRGDVSSLASSITYLIDNPIVAESYALEATKRATKKFSSEIVLRQWKNIVKC